MIMIMLHKSIVREWESENGNAFSQKNIVFLALKVTIPIQSTQRRWYRNHSAVVKAMAITTSQNQIGRPAAALAIFCE